MKHSEEQMMAKAKKILSDLQGEYYNDDNIEGIRYNEKDNVVRPKGQTIQAWTIYVREPLFESSIFLLLSDETGEPLYIQNKHGILEIEKDLNDKYIPKK
jgi:hypothetical protein